MTLSKADSHLLFYAARCMQHWEADHFANFGMYDHALCLELGHKRGAITSFWNPLEENDSAFSMAVFMNFSIEMVPATKRVTVTENAYGCPINEWWSGNDPIDRHKAVRRAIVRCAARLGELVDKDRVCS